MLLINAFACLKWTTWPHYPPPPPLLRKFLKQLLKPTNLYDICIHIFDIRFTHKKTTKKPHAIELTKMVVKFLRDGISNFRVNVKVFSFSFW